MATHGRDWVLDELVQQALAPMESETMTKKTVLIVHAQPEPTSVTRQLVDVGVQALQAQGHQVLQSDLYAMRWKAVFDEQDFPGRGAGERLSFVEASGHAYLSGQQAPDVAAEQRKVLAADAVLFQFPLWWFGMPALMKGWIDRVWAHGLAYGYRGAGNRYRYGEGAFQGKRALLAVAVGGPAADYAPRGINGPLEQLLFPITHGCLFFPGFEVLPTYAVYSTGRIDAQAMAAAQAAWRARVEGLFDDAPIPFRPQNGGDYPDGHLLAGDAAPGQSGLPAHIAAGPAPAAAFTADPQPAAAARA
jgi:NAD(P)H dehydrogenase (quinone)